MPKIFISYNYYDEHFKRTIDNWKNQDLGMEISFISVVADYRPLGSQMISEKLRGEIDNASAILVLVGSNAHSSPWLDFEIKYATSTEKKILWSQIPGTNGAPPLEIRNKPEVKFSLDEIQKAIRGLKL